MFELTAVITEDGTKVTNDVDDEEDGAFLGSHGKITALGISFNWMSPSSFHQQVVDLSWRAKNVVTSISSKSKDQDND